MITDYGAPLRSRRRSFTTRALARDSTLRRLDWAMLFGVFALSVLGLLLVWSATRAQLLAGGSDPQYFLRKQALNVSVGLAFGVVVASFDYRALRAYGPLIYAVSCFSLVLVLTPLGTTINGSSSWLALGGGPQIQPSEPAKVAVLLVVAAVLGEARDREYSPGDRNVVQALALAAVPMGLILLQPDLGTSLVFGTMVLGMVAVAGAPRRWLVGLVTGVTLAAAGAVYFRLLESYQLARFSAFANPAAAPEAATYSAQQAQLAVGSGGLFGKGLFGDSLTSGQYVPEQQSDFIFTVAGEQFGFVGSVAIVALLTLVLWRGLRIAACADDMFGRLIATGVVCWFGFQIFQNIGMTLGLMPVIGLPLPFVSYGGSSMFANLVAVGLLQNIHLTSSYRSTSRKR